MRNLTAGPELAPSPYGYFQFPSRMLASHSSASRLASAAWVFLDIFP